MDEIIIPYHLAIPAIICIISLGIIIFYRKRLFSKNKIFWISAVVFLILYLLIVGSSAYDDIYFQWDLNRYDLNQDGIFSGIEKTEEQEMALQRLVNDVGRNFSFISGLVFAFIFSTVIYFIGLILSKSIKTITDKRGKDHSDRAIEEP